MSPVRRQVVEGPQAQGVDESIVYDITTTPWGTSPSSPSYVVKDMNASLADITTDVSTGNAPGISGDVLTIPTIKPLAADRKYRVEVKFTADAQDFETFFIIEVEL